MVSKWYDLIGLLETVENYSCIQGLVVCRLKLCYKSVLDMETFDSNSVLSCIWLRHSKSLCPCLRPQGVKSGQGMGNIALRMFERNLHPTDFPVAVRVVATQEFCSLLQDRDTKRCGVPSSTNLPRRSRS